MDECVIVLLYKLMENQNDQDIDIDFYFEQAQKNSYLDHEKRIE